MIKIGETYIFKKSGNPVKVLARDSVKLNGKKINGFTVSRVDTGKRMFVPTVGLIKKEDLECQVIKFMK